METKKCKKCEREMTLDNFYTHKYMQDGHLNICKDCVKTRVSKHRENNIDKIRAYDRERGKLPHRVRKSCEATKRRRKDTGYGKIHEALERAVESGKCNKSNMCQVCGASNKKLEAHHYDYSKPLEVIWLCQVCHRQYHLGKTSRAETVRIIVDNIAKLHSDELKAKQV